MRLSQVISTFIFTLIEAIQPISATMLQSMWYALRSKVSECVMWLAMSSTKKKAVVKNSTRYSCTGCSLLNHSFTAMTLSAKSYERFYSLQRYRGVYRGDHVIPQSHDIMITNRFVLSAIVFDSSELLFTIVCKRYIVLMEKICRKIR